VIHRPDQRGARREKYLDVAWATDTELRVVATLRDTSTAVDDPDDVELIHQLRIEATVTLPDLVIQEISGHADAQPYDQCSHTAAPVSKLAAWFGPLRERGPGSIIKLLRSVTALFLLRFSLVADFGP